MDEARLIEKLLAVEALHAGAATEGERVAAENARRRILDRLKKLVVEDPPIEYRFSMTDMWSRKVFVALLRRYDIPPYRYKGQRYTTVMVKVPRRFVDETLWPEFQELSDTLKSYLAEVTDRVVSRVIHADSSEADVVTEPPLLTLVARSDHDEAASTSGIDPSVSARRSAAMTDVTGQDSKIAPPNQASDRNRRKRQARKKRKKKRKR